MADILTVYKSDEYSGSGKLAHKFVDNGDGTYSEAIAATVTSTTLPTGAATAANQVIGNAPLLNFGAGEYETVAASQTAQVLGSTGAANDYVAGVLVVPATTSPGLVTLLDGATSIPVFVGGASSVSNLVPFFIPLGAKCITAWKLTTGANVSCIAFGNFT